MSEMAGFLKNDFENTHDDLLSENFRENTFDGKIGSQGVTNSNDILLPSI